MRGQASEVIHNVPHLVWPDTWASIEPLHRRGTADAIPDIHEKVAIGGAVVPLIVGEIGRTHLVRGHGGSDVADAIALRSVAVRAEPVVEFLS